MLSTLQLLKEGKTDQAAQKARVLLAKEAIAKQMDQAADMAELSVAQIQANNATKRMTAMMAQSSRTMSRAQKQMNPEKVRLFFFFWYICLHVTQRQDREREKEKERGQTTLAY